MFTFDCFYLRIYLRPEAYFGTWGVRFLLELFKTLSVFLNLFYKVWFKVFQYTIDDFINNLWALLFSNYSVPGWETLLQLIYDTASLVYLSEFLTMFWMCTLNFFFLLFNCYIGKTFNKLQTVSRMEIQTVISKDIWGTSWKESEGH